MIEDDLLKLVHRGEAPRDPRQRGGQGPAVHALLLRQRDAFGRTLVAGQHGEPVKQATHDPRPALLHEDSRVIHNQRFSPHTDALLHGLLRGHAEVRGVEVAALRNIETHHRDQHVEELLPLRLVEGGEAETLAMRVPVDPALAWADPALHPAQGLGHGHGLQGEALEHQRREDGAQRQQREKAVRQNHHDLRGDFHHRPGELVDQELRAQNQEQAQDESRLQAVQHVSLHSAEGPQQHDALQVDESQHPEDEDPQHQIWDRRARHEQESLHKEAQLVEPELGLEVIVEHAEDVLPGLVLQEMPLLEVPQHQPEHQRDGHPLQSRNAGRDDAEVHHPLRRHVQPVAHA
mmetsp:Transcript_81303/g.195109  ORF Transcript_81303/g.195109 Transcript_81303/m.195109 type:complete len:348 (+) Transcript_81303:461-1504(+)